ncbi:TA system VapC family ribonuclease toxin [Spirochaeta dissipatitropha]
MLLCDVNVLIYAHREDSEKHSSAADFLYSAIKSREPFAFSQDILSSFLRVVTHPKIFKEPSPFDIAVAFCDRIIHSPYSVAVQAGETHWNIFCHLCRALNAAGNVVPDAYLAALSIESGCKWVSFDRDFLRYPGLDFLLLE